MRHWLTIAALLVAAVAQGQFSTTLKTVLSGDNPILFEYHVGDSLSTATFSRTSTATYRDAAGVLQTAISGAARDNHYALDPVSGLYKRSLLLEGQRTNLLLLSEEFDNATAWPTASTNVTISANATTAPDGTATADRLVETATTSQHIVYQQVTGTAAAYTYSVFLKAAERTFAQVYFNDPGGTDYGVSVDLSNGTIGTTTGTITSSRIEPWPNGWYRVSITKTLTAAAGWYCVIGLAVADGAIRASYLGVITNGISSWGSQLELGAFPSSYIPTTTATVTRASDSLNLPINFNPQELSIFVRGHELGSYFTGGRALEIADANSLNPRQLITGNGTLWYLNAGGAATTASLTMASALGDRRDVVQVLTANGISKALGSNNGGATVVATNGVTLGSLDAAWSGNLVWIGNIPSGQISFFAFRDIIIAKRERDLAFFLNRINN